MSFYDPRPINGTHGMTDREVANWIEAYDEAFEADVATAERANPPEKGGRGKTRDAESHVSGDVLRQIRRDRNWWRDLGRRTAVKGRERIVLDALLDRIWTGPDDPRRGRVNGQWTGAQSAIKSDIGDALGLRSIKYAVVGLMEKGIITRRFQGRRHAAGGGRGRSVYLILPSNPHERREGT